MMRQSETIAKLGDALAKAQAEMKNVGFNRKNPHFKSQYADLAAIRDGTAPILSKYGLSIIQFTGWTERGVALHTRLLHSSGEWLEGDYPLPNVPDKPQVMGSALTYARRYGWGAMCGIASEEDDDGEVAQTEVKGAPAKAATQQRAAVAPKTKTETPFDHAVGPSLIKVAMDEEGNPDWRGWGSAFVSALGSAKTAQDVEAWCQANAAPLRNLRATQEALGKRVDDRIAEAYARVARPGDQPPANADSGELLMAG